MVLDDCVKMIMEKPCDSPGHSFKDKALWATDQLLFNAEWFRERSVLACVLEEAIEAECIRRAVIRVAKEKVSRDGVSVDSVEGVKVQFLDEENGYDVSLVLGDNTVVDVVVFCDEVHK